MRDFERLANRLAKFELLNTQIDYYFKTSQILLSYGINSHEALKAVGFPIVQTNELYSTLNTRLTELKEQSFCITDIETNNSDPNIGQIIEIGAIKFCKGKIIDEFESLVYFDEPLNIHIEELTKISHESLKKAPKESQILEKFRNFLADDVFVAHNVNFDYEFISSRFQAYGFPPMLNRKLCTVELAKKCFKFEKYGLEFLKDALNLSQKESHRALADANNATEVLQKCMEKLPQEICTVEELIAFSAHRQKRRKKPKKS